MNDFKIFSHMKESTKFQFCAIPPAEVGAKDLTKIRTIGIIINIKTINK